MALRSSFLKLINNSLLKNSSLLMLNSVQVTVIGFFFWVLAARLFEPQAIGLATVLMSIIVLVLHLSRVGMDWGLMSYLPIYRNKNNLYSTVIVITGLISLALGLTAFLLLRNFSEFSILANWAYLPLFLGCVTVYLLSDIHNMALLSLKQFERSLLQNFLNGLRLPLLFLFAAYGVAGILASYAFSYLVSLLAGIGMVYRSGVKLKPTIDRDVIELTLGYSLGNFVANSFTILPNTAVPILIVMLLGATQNAFFYISFSISSILFMIPTAISTTLFVDGSNDRPRRQNYYQGVKFFLLIYALSFLVFLIFGHEILAVFSPEYSAHSYDLLQLLNVANFFSGLNLMYISLKKVSRDMKTVMAVNVLSSLTSIAFTALFILFLGFDGIGLASIASNLLIFLLIVYLLNKEYKLLLPLADRLERYAGYLASR